MRLERDDLGAHELRGPPARQRGAVPRSVRAGRGRGLHRGPRRSLHRRQRRGLSASSAAVATRSWASGSSTSSPRRTWRASRVSGRVSSRDTPRSPSGPCGAPTAATSPSRSAGRSCPDGRWQAFVRDISERKRAEALIRRGREEDEHLRADLEQITRASARVSESVLESPTPDLTAVLRTIATQAQVLTGARYVAVGLGTDPDKPFDPWISLGVAPDAAAAFERHPAARRLAGDGGPGRGSDPAPGTARSATCSSPRRRGRPRSRSRDQRMVEMLAARAASRSRSVKLYAGEAGPPELAAKHHRPDAGGGDAARRARPGRGDEPRPARARRARTRGAVDDRGNPAIFDVRPPDGRPIPFDEFLVVRALRAARSATDQEHLVRQRDGRFVPVLVSAAPVRDDAGRITGAVAVIRDMTTLKELERLREEWASIVAHDLRQPVGAISLTAESLSRLHQGEPAAAGAQGGRAHPLGVGEAEPHDRGPARRLADRGQAAVGGASPRRPRPARRGGRREPARRHRRVRDPGRRRAGARRP